MYSLVMFLLWAFPGQRECGPSECVSYLYQPSYCNDELLRLPARPYQPQPGDMRGGWLGERRDSHPITGLAIVIIAGIILRGIDGRTLDLGFVRNVLHLVDCTPNKKPRRRLLDAAVSMLVTTC